MKIQYKWISKTNIMGADYWFFSWFCEKSFWTGNAGVLWSDHLKYTFYLSKKNIFFFLNEAKCTQKITILIC